MIEIDGLLWFVGAVVVFGVHALHIRSWRRERRQYQAWLRRYDASAQRRHDATMQAFDRDDAFSAVPAWKLDGRRKRGRA